MPTRIEPRAFPTAQVRRSLDELPDTMDASTNPPDPSELYVVLGHERALDPNSTLFVGDRGSGKSFWSAALNSRVTRALIHAQLPRLHLDRAETSWGFSVSTRNPDHPSRRVLQHLQRDHSAEDIWRAVVLRQLASRHDKPLPGREWSEVVAHVAEHPEHEERVLNRISDRLAAGGKRHLLIFDALGRAGSD
jgi:hypothetical protein